MDQEIYPGGNPQEEDRMPGGSPPPAPDKAVEEDRMPGAKVSSNLSGKLKSQKWLLFALFGLIGGACGPILGFITPSVGEEHLWQFVVEQGIWTALTSAILTGALFLANEAYARRSLSPGVFCKGILVGLLGGAISGSIAQWLCGTSFGPQWFQGNPIQIFCWGIMGGLLGLFLSQAMPNFGFLKGICGGFAGGLVGGACFLFAGRIVNSILPDFSGRLADLLGQMVGMGILGAALGMIMVIVESIFREASLEVVWAPNESSFFNLGSEPIYIGGGKEDQIYVRGLGERHSHVVFAGGTIEYVDAESQNRTPLRNGSSLQIGTLKLVIHAAK